MRSVRDGTNEILELIRLTMSSLPQDVEGRLQAISEWEDLLSKSYQSILTGYLQE